MKIGIDGLKLSVKWECNTVETVPDSENINFSGIKLHKHTTSDFVDHVSNTLLPEYANDLEEGLLYWHYSKAQPKAGYFHQFQLYNIKGHCLITCLISPKKPYLKHNIIDISGLCFSDSALNPLRDIDLVSRIQHFVKNENCNLVAADFYIDDFNNLIPYYQIREQSTPTNYKKHLRGFLVKSSKRLAELLPNHQYAETVYFGHRSERRSKVCLYQKHLCPRQDICTPDNQLKFSWNRLELRLRGDQAKTQGKALLLSDSFGADLAVLFPKYLDFVDTVGRKAIRQQWYADLLQQVALYNNVHRLTHQNNQQPTITAT